jgi:2-hydroxychromene-2-carboxylate isomerase
MLHDFVSTASTQQSLKRIFAKRSQNYVAHEMAVYVRKTGVDSICNNSFPVNVHKAMDHDCNSNSLIMK